MKEIYPTDFFDWPVKHSVRLSGTFGELRPNHFHAGVDLKSSKGGVGDPLYAAGEGYISRIKIQAAGYGAECYIWIIQMASPRFYAHMHAFTDELEDYVKEMQYEKQQFEVDLYPEQNRFFFEKGAYIGKLGTTGSSFGPHFTF